MKKFFLTILLSLVCLPAFALNDNRGSLYVNPNGLPTYTPTPTATYPPGTITPTPYFPGPHKYFTSGEITLINNTIGTNQPFIELGCSGTRRIVVNKIECALNYSNVQSPPGYAYQLMKYGVRTADSAPATHMATTTAGRFSTLDPASTVAVTIDYTAPVSAGSFLVPNAIQFVRMTRVYDSPLSVIFPPVLLTPVPSTNGTDQFSVMQPIYSGASIYDGIALENSSQVFSLGAGSSWAAGNADVYFDWYLEWTEF